ncbi:Z1 domain-containing protein [Caproicibacter sp.]|uniref:Z1 domain-containing protein n=1 Tax=Caproicibacter sp. TaxID=2814884 RepID=UPI003988FEB5
MEEYIIKEQNANEFTIVQGEFYSKIYNKHVLSYGEQGANNIRDNIISTYRESQLQLYSHQKNNNMLLVGRVQSGKTSNLELFTALAFDNGYNLVVIYGGYDNTLLTQTTTRFKKTFDIPNDTTYDNSAPVIFSSDDSTQLLSVDDEIIEDLLEAKKPIFLISMKRPAAMSKVNRLLTRINKSNLKAFIIDDEGDQASLNTKKNKVKDASATYAEIVKMKSLISDPLYLSVTATPQANIFLNEYSALRPDSIRLIEPGKGYCGAEVYHLFNSDTIEIIDEAEELTGKLSASLRSAINHYLIASAIMKLRGILTSDMIIHSHRNVSDHSEIYSSIDGYIQEFKDTVKYKDESFPIRKKELFKVYNNCFSEQIQAKYSFDDIFEKVCEVVKRTYIILKNSAGRITQANENLRKHRIYIGGDLLQRGVTFPRLVTTYFTRWANDGGNMDTNLQRARWFGYRNSYIDICKIFTTEEIAREFTTLSEIEEDLWEQFYSIQNGEMAINDILIQAENTRQKPTRKNVASYKSVAFKSRWIKQRVGIFDKIQLDHNNNVVLSVLEGLPLIGTSAGRVDGAQTASYVLLSKDKINKLVEQIQTVFDLEPFERKPLADLLATETTIPVILMSGFDGEGRKRSFYRDNKIYALHQGADSKETEKINYQGDSFVIVNKDCVNIQIHKIIPKKELSSGRVQELPEFTQYMFAIYLPKERVYFVKG